MAEQRQQVVRVLLAGDEDGSIPVRCIFPLLRPDCEPEDRHLLCQHSVELAVQDLLAAAVSAGWDEQEVIVAISDVCDQLALSKAANDDLFDIPQGNEEACPLTGFTWGL